MKRSRSLILALAALLPWPLAVQARPAGGLASNSVASRSVSYSVWAIDGPTVRVRYTLPTAVARGLVAPGAPAPTLAAAASAVGSGLAVSAGGQDCAAIDQGEGAGLVYTLALTPGVERFEMIFRCPRAEGITLHDRLLFGRSPDHVDYALIKRGGGSALQTFTSHRQDLILTPGALTDAGIGDVAWRGFLQRARSPEDLCVVAALLLLSRRWRDLAFIAGGLGAGYFASLLAAVDGILAARPAMTETAADGLLLLLGAGVLCLQAKAAPISGRWRAGAAVILGLLGLAAAMAAILVYPQAGLVMGGLAIFCVALFACAGAGLGPDWLVFAFAAAIGLLDGMRLASDLSPLHLPSLRLAPLLAGHDLGSILASVGVAAAAMAALWIAARRVAFARRAAEDFAGAGVLGLGVFWFVTSLYS